MKNMKLKAILAVILVIATLFTFTACTGGGEGGDTDSGSVSDTQSGSDSGNGDTSGEIGSGDDSSSGEAENTMEPNGSAALGDVTVNSPLSELMTALMTNVEVPYMTVESEGADRFEWFFFIDPIENAETYVSEAMINAQAHSVGLLRVPEGQSVDDVKKNIEDKIDPRKWICVEAEASVVLSKGDVILLAMSHQEVVDQIAENFNSIAE